MEDIGKELEEKLQTIKNLIDEAYDTTKNKYNEEWANTAMANCLLYGKTNNFTRENNARNNIKNITNRPNEIYQVLLDYALSSFMLNDMSCDITNDEIIAYVNDREGNLDYSGKKAVKIIAITTAMNTYWTYNILSLNKKLKLELVLSFIAERYNQNKRKELDNSRKAKSIKIEGYKKTPMMSKFNLNNDVRNMNSDDEIEEYTSPTRK